jgi:hypothetical protein
MRQSGKCLIFAGLPIEPTILRLKLDGVIDKGIIAGDHRKKSEPLNPAGPKPRRPTIDIMY